VIHEQSKNFQRSDISSDEELVKKSDEKIRKLKQAEIRDTEVDAKMRIIEQEKRETQAGIAKAEFELQMVLQERAASRHKKEMEQHEKRFETTLKELKNRVKDKTNFIVDSLRQFKGGAFNTIAKKSSYRARGARVYTDFHKEMVDHERNELIRKEKAVETVVKLQEKRVSKLENLKRKRDQTIDSAKETEKIEKIDEEVLRVEGLIENGQELEKRRKEEAREKRRKIQSLLVET
jgi:hypothetical protein